ncbi:hypothetical protein CIHG_02938 [Coccidioides immitis H538.4]|uniref:Uncharacterized protein n=1 Tax=Coccidioides immitis H538.4 TaxID=396776 RepID=A0A0J8RKJ3_COCIT|nr:hypothetical protein CIHG_02938 [Coccidioides immitis H538.4]TPX19732.1 hypothetical protein DIZ76_017524 [Coccidioides immitis]
MDITGKIIRDVLKPPPTEEELNFELDFWEDADGEDVRSLLWAADAASRSAFCQVPFAAWALTALDEEVPAMELLHWYLDFIAVKLSNRLRRCPGIEEHLPEVLCEASPPGCLVISSAVKRSRGGKASRTNRDFVKQPLQHLFHQPFAGPVADALRILDL